jgi:hypothetical protein
LAEKVVALGGKNRWIWREKSLDLAGKSLDLAGKIVGFGGKKAAMDCGHSCLPESSQSFHHRSRSYDRELQRQRCNILHTTSQLAYYVLCKDIFLIVVKTLRDGRVVVVNAVVVLLAYCCWRQNRSFVPIRYL